MYVTDTHSLIYYADRKLSRLGKDARRIFQKADNQKTLIWIPTVVLWEIAQRLDDGSMKLAMSFDLWCRHLNSSGGFSIAALEWEDVHEARRFPFKDPFDCLIAGTAARLRMPLITKDSQISESGLTETIW